MTHKSQADELLAFLTGRWPEWTPAYLLTQFSLSYTRRIFEIRQRGIAIDIDDHYVEGQRRTAYRLIKENASKV